MGEYGIYMGYTLPGIWWVFSADPGGRRLITYGVSG